jgi:uncharacterized protein YfdQ (DUF2303 family)
MEALMLKHAGTQVLDPIAETQGKATLALIPKGMEVTDLGPMLAKTRMQPIRRTGTATLQDLDSFIAHVNRFRDADSVVFCDQADPAKPKLLAVLDYHRAGADQVPRFCVHRAAHAFPLSEAWKTWAGKNDQAMGQAAFAELIEERIADLLVPPSPMSEETADASLIAWVRQMGTRFADAATMLELSRGLLVRQNVRVKNAVTLASGEAQMAYETEHTTDVGAPLTIPGAFLLALPVFDRGAAYRVPVRLRYRVADGKVVWRYLLHRPDAVFRDALNEALGQVRKETGLPVLIGTPES